MGAKHLSVHCVFPRICDRIYGKSDTKLTLKLVNVYFALYKTDKNTAPNYREVRLCEKATSQSVSFI